MCLMSFGVQEEQLRSGEALVALLRKRLQQRDSELDALRKKVVEEAKVSIEARGSC